MFKNLNVTRFGLTLALASTLALLGCGGGGGDSSVVSTTPSTSPVGGTVSAVDVSITTPSPYFSDSSIQVTELNTYFDSMCGGRTNINQIIPANLNGNGKKDLAITLMCMDDTHSKLTEPTPSRLVILIQQNDGSFLDKTKEKFGSSFEEIGGNAITYVINDFNNDGFDDIVIAVSYEDGRTFDASASTVNAQNTFITSKGDGTYALSRLGTTAWNYQLRLVENELGGHDVLSLPIGAVHENNLYRYTSSGWQVVELDWTNGKFGGPATLPLSKNNGFTTNPLVISGAWGNDVGLNLWEKKNGSWQQGSSYILGSATSVPWIGWNGMAGTVALMKFDGQDYVSMSFEKMCETKLKSTDTNAVAVVALTASIVSGGYTGALLVEGSVGLIPVTKLMVFDVSSGKFNLISSLDLDGPLNIATEGFECRDVNADGIPDILIQDYHFNAIPAPVLLLGDGKGGFKRAPQSSFPVDSDFKNTATGYMLFDINGDGFMDFLNFPAGGLQNYSSSNKVYLKLHKGLMNF